MIGFNFRSPFLHLKCAFPHFSVAVREQWGTAVSCPDHAAGDLHWPGVFHQFFLCLPVQVLQFLSADVSPAPLSVVPRALELFRDDGPSFHVAIFFI